MNQETDDSGFNHISLYACTSFASQVLKHESLPKDFYTPTTLQGVVQESNFGAQSLYEANSKHLPENLSDLLTSSRSSKYTEGITHNSLEQESMSSSDVLSALQHSISQIEKSKSACVLLSTFAHSIVVWYPSNEAKALLFSPPGKIKIFKKFKSLEDLVLKTIPDSCSFNIHTLSAATESLQSQNTNDDNQDQKQPEALNDENDRRHIDIHNYLSSMSNNILSMLDTDEAQNTEPTLEEPTSVEPAAAVITDAPVETTQNEGIVETPIDATSNTEAVNIKTYLTSMGDELLSKIAQEHERTEDNNDTTKSTAADAVEESIEENNDTTTTLDAVEEQPNASETVATSDIDDLLQHMNDLLAGANAKAAAIETEMETSSIITKVETHDDENNQDASEPQQQIHEEYEATTPVVIPSPPIRLTDNNSCSGNKSGGEVRPKLLPTQLSHARNAAYNIQQSADSTSTHEFTKLPKIASARREEPLPAAPPIPQENLKLPPIKTPRYDDANTTELKDQSVLESNLPKPPKPSTISSSVEETTSSRDARMERIKAVRQQKLSQMEKRSEERRKLKSERAASNKPKTNPSSTRSGPNRASNRKLVRNAIEFNLLPGLHLQDSRQVVLDALDASESQNFLIVFRGSKSTRFRSLYSLDVQANTAVKIYGKGPVDLILEKVKQFYRYNSGRKEFTPVHTSSFTIKTDAAGICESCFPKLKQSKNY